MVFTRNSFVCFTVDKENCGEPAKQQRKGKNKTRRKLMLCFLSELLYPHLVRVKIYSVMVFTPRRSSFRPY